MKLTDITLKEVRVHFSEEALLTPFQLSSGSITHITYASATITVENRLGQVAQGVGSILLSELWSFPGTELTSIQKTGAMQDLVHRIRDRLSSYMEYGDPLQIAHQFKPYLSKLSREVEETCCLQTSIPTLAETVCWSPFDAALHDGWGKCFGKSAYKMYNRQFLNDDLGEYLGEDWKCLYPNDFLVSRKLRLPIQHVVGISDRLISSECPSGVSKSDAFPVSLNQWIERDGVHCFKLKLKGTDLKWDLQRIKDVHCAAKKTLKKTNIKKLVRLALDPNEACPHPDLMVELLAMVKHQDQELYDSIDYIEQPTHRNLSSYKYTLHELSKLKPILMDESLDGLDSLRFLEPLGWNGLALKTCKGQSEALLTYCWAKRRKIFITLQDLTNPGLALVHSANLSSHFDLSSDAFECNSRQYLPKSCPHEVGQYPELFVADEGQISLNQIRNIGLY